MRLVNGDDIVCRVPPLQVITLCMTASCSHVNRVVHVSCIVSMQHVLPAVVHKHLLLPSKQLLC